MAPRSAKTQPANGTKKGTSTAMPPTSAGNNNNTNISNGSSSNSKQNFSFDIVAALLLIMRERGITISRTHYELMSALDGNRTADAFQHQFRAVLARAKVLHEQREQGVEFEAVKPVSKGRSKGAGSNNNNNKTNNKRKRGNGDGDEGDGDDGGVKSSKKKSMFS